MARTLLSIATKVVGIVAFVLMLGGSFICGVYVGYDLALADQKAKEHNVPPGYGGHIPDLVPQDLKTR